MTREIEPEYRIRVRVEAAMSLHDETWKLRSTAAMMPVEWPVVEMLWSDDGFIPIRD